jgi:hypothetical protein
MSTTTPSKSKLSKMDHYINGHLFWYFLSEKY